MGKSCEYSAMLLRLATLYFANSKVREVISTFGITTLASRFLMRFSVILSRFKSCCFMFSPMTAKKRVVPSEVSEVSYTKGVVAR